MVAELTSINIYNNETLENIAQQVLNETNTFDGQCTQIIKLARALGINVFTADILDSDVSGILKIEDGEYNIYIEKKQPATRQRFTIAHEIAHYILHRDLINRQQGSVLYRKDFNSNTPVESQANTLAAALLMPRNEIIKAWKTLNNIQDVASCFQVSTQAAYIRLNKLGVIVG